MALAASISSKYVAGLMRSTTSGLPAAVALLARAEGLNLAPLGVAQILEHNAPPEVLEKVIRLEYPFVNIYCEKITNSLREKFRIFSGSARLVIEVRVTNDHWDNPAAELQVYVDAVTKVLDANRGNWGQGMFYAGGYEITYSGLKSGGRNYIQTAKIGLTIEIGS